MRIYYDRIKLYHPTTPDGCRYKCDFPSELGGLGKGDMAVFSATFDVFTAQHLRNLGVLIGFETGESPLHIPPLKPRHLRLVGCLNCLLCNEATWPLVGGHFHELSIGFAGSPDA